MKVLDGEFCVLLNEDVIEWNSVTPFDVALGWRFRSREAAEGCCVALNRLLGYARFKVGVGFDCDTSTSQLAGAQIT
jgi:hypothetical protein